MAVDAKRSADEIIIENTIRNVLNFFSQIFFSINFNIIKIMFTSLLIYKMNVKIKNIKLNLSLIKFI